MRIHYVVIGLLTLASTAFAGDETIPPAQMSAYLNNLVQSGASGTEFWIAIPRPGNNNTGQMQARYEIHVTSEHQTNVTVYYPDEPFYSNSKVVEPGKVTVFSSSQKMQEEFWISSNEISNSSEIRKGICISSEHPVTATYYSFVGSSVESCRILPQHTLGLEYRYLSYYSYRDGNEDRNGGCLILATRPNTLVEISLPRRPNSVVRSMDGHYAGERYSVMLDSGEVYALATATVDSVLTADLSGAKIKADKPVAVVSFHFGSKLPMVAGDESPSVLIEMLPPVSSWGKSHVAMMAQLTAGPNVENLYRIVAAEDNTDYRMLRVDMFDGSILDRNEGVLSNAGEWSEIGDTDPESSGNVKRSVTIWSSNKPTLLMQYGVSHSSGGISPFMMHIPPLEQFVTGKTSFYVPPGAGQIHVFAVNNSNQSPGDLTSVTLDGKAIGQLDARFYSNRFPETNIHYLSVAAQAGHVQTINSQTPYAAMLFGSFDNGHYGSNLVGSAYKVDQPDLAPPVLSARRQCHEFHFTATELTVNDVEGPERQIDQGVAAIRLIPELSENFELILNDPPVLEAYRGEHKVDFSLIPIDWHSSGKAVFVVRDRAGNIVVDSVSYVYQPDNQILRVDSYRHDFGVVRTNDRPELLLEIKNVTEELLLVNSFSFARGSNLFYVSPGDNAAFELQPGETRNVRVVYKPVRENAGGGQADFDTLVINTPCRAFVTTALQGRAGLPRVAAIRDLDFGDVIIGERQCHEQYIGIYNQGYLPLEVDLEDLTNQFLSDEQPVFYLKNDQFSGDGENPVPPGDTLKLRVFCFAPTEPGESSRTFRINHNGAGSSEFTLKGNGLLPTSAAERDPSMMTELTILDPVPHPISGDAALRVVAPHPGPLELEVCDALGRVCAAMRAENAQSGVQTFRLQTNDLPAGVYFIVCKNGRSVQRRAIRLQ